MSHRKLQQEVDKVFKKVNEGLEIFNQYHERHESSTNSSQKDKLENDLKREIKKLQKLREQIKVWQSTNDIKDKTSLLEYRRNIEVAMEKYKVIEKGSKIKAYSNMNLKNNVEIDPEQKEKLECISFIQDSIDELDRQFEIVEVELDKLSSKKGKKSQNSNKDDLKELQSKYRWHQQQLEIALRLLENGELQIDDINEIKEELVYFLENNRDDNFIENEYIYESLDLESNEFVQNEITNSFVNDQLPEKSESISPIPTPSVISTPSKKESISSQTPLKSKSSLKKPSVSTPVQQTASIPPTSININLANNLKPAVAPAPPVNEVKWSSLLSTTDVKKEEEIPVLTKQTLNSTLPTSTTEETLNSIINTTTVSNDISSTSETIATIIAAPKASVPSNQSESFKQESKVEVKEELPVITSPVNEDDYFNDFDIVKLPPGIQDILCSFYSARSSTSTDTKIDNANKILEIPRFYQDKYSINSASNSLELNRCFNLWSLIRFKILNETIDSFREKIIQNLELGLLFYVYYFNYSKLEKTIIEQELIRRKWINVNQYWYLRLDQNQSTNNGVLSGNFKKFNYQDWKFVDLINFKLSLETSGK
ncbi:hypothetical protein WICMUC_005225 [Wickerhamomyces mucosus]|uniref:General negative regulator of transcription subunit n=1 Tax=Wickerhamomyces mucosus TaxID=1378264 RepID=A0A9P8PA68_9ASCO|nr:hypothetical protein WICMUC_005225 [Wickerhamomyces mucosus]